MELLFATQDAGETQAWLAIIREVGFGAIAFVLLFKIVPNIQKCLETFLNNLVASLEEDRRTEREYRAKEIQMLIENQSRMIERLERSLGARQT